VVRDLCRKRKWVVIRESSGLHDLKVVINLDLHGFQVFSIYQSFLLYVYLASML
jgi:hypothetical protein